MALALLIEPAGQGAHSLPEAAKEPAGQEVQDKFVVAPTTEDTKPRGHCVHDEDPGELENVPREQEEQVFDAAPTIGLADPAGQGTQGLCPREYVPALQVIHRSMSNEEACVSNKKELKEKGLI